VTDSDRRNTQRFHLKLPLVVRWSGEDSGKAATATKDVSSRGVYFFLSKDVVSGSPVEILMTLPNELTLAGPVQVRCLGRVHRSEKLENGQLGVVVTIDRYEFLRGDEEEASA
jgi:hypothetical protein